MRCWAILFCFLGSLCWGDHSTLAASTHQMAAAFQVQDEEPENDRWGFIAASAGILGLVLITLPYVSILGLILGVGGLMAGIFFRKRMKKRKWLATVGIVTGAICLSLFFAVAGLILFF
ncbi:MAG: hypothetical protein AAFP83_08550 [Bacteroidota bacterium]